MLVFLMAGGSSRAVWRGRDEIRVNAGRNGGHSLQMVKTALTRRALHAFGFHRRTQDRRPGALQSPVVPAVPPPPSRHFSAEFGRGYPIRVNDD
jgi:hypothetical protein